MNPLKLQNLQYSITQHRVIMPVYIPNNEGYYKECFEMLKLSVQSLLQTTSSNTKITIINNNCFNNVSQYLEELFKQKKIDQLINNNQNKGKVEAVLDAFRNSKEDIITITDCDVLFKQNWLYNTQKVFKTFKNVGYVSPLPLPGSHSYFSGWSWYYGLFSKTLVQEKHSDIESLKTFNKSILYERELTDIEKKPFKLVKGDVKAVIGSGHFCGTYNRNIIEKIPYSFSGKKFTGAERLYFDKPIEEAGFLRLSTDKGWVYHMGNSVKDWMHQVIKDNKKEELKELSVTISNKGYSGVVKTLIKKFLMSTKFKKLKYKFVKK